jgi:hypothetical protein
MVENFDIMWFNFCQYIEFTPRSFDAMFFIYKNCLKRTCQHVKINNLLFLHIFKIDKDRFFVLAFELSWNFKLIGPCSVEKNNHLEIPNPHLHERVSEHRDQKYFGEVSFWQRNIGTDPRYF